MARIQNKVSNHCISNHLKRPLLNLYLDNRAIIHPGLGGNDVVHNFGSTRRSVLLGPSTLRGSVSVPTVAFFPFYTIFHTQNIVQWKTEFFISSYFQRTTH